MSDEPDSRLFRPLIDAAAKAAFLAALRGGARREDAAAEAGFSLTGFYGARSRDPAFAADWKEALRQPPAAERRASAYDARGEPGEVRLSPANRRPYQQRRRRHVRFDAEAQDVFLTHFAATCDTVAAAEKAGVSESTVHLHRRSDREFAEAYAAALAEGYVRLEVEAVRLRLEAQQRYRAAVAAADAIPSRRRGPAAGQPPLSQAEIGAEFDRVMKLLARHDRKQRGPDTRFSEGSRRRSYSFDDAMELLAKRLTALGYKPMPPEGEAG